MQLLVENAGQLVKKEQLITKIWQDSFVEDANITQQIYILRKTLGNNKNGKPFIQTLPKRGYSFVGEVQKIENQAFPTKNELPVNEQTEAETISNSANSKSKAFQYFLAGLGVLIVLGIIYFFQFRKTTTETNSIKSIAVLPFKKIGAENDDSKIGFGLADAVINNLSKQQKIPVRSMSAVFQYAEKDVYDPIEAGKTLGVDSILEGTVQREDEKVRVSLRLLKISDGSTLWAETFNEKFSNIFALQDSISVKVASSVLPNLSPQDKQIVAQKPANSEAFQFYQLGVYFANVRNQESMEKAVLYFQKAIELDPNYALSYAMLADTYNRLNEYADEQKSKELFDKSEEASKKALALDDSLAEAYLSMAFVQFAKYKDSDAGRKSLEQAVQLAPYNPSARLHYGWELLRHQDLEGAYQQTKLALEYDPLSANTNMVMCSIWIYKRDYSQALNACERAGELQPTLPFINIQKASILFLTGKNNEAIDLLILESKDETQKYYALGNLGYIYAKLGKREEAEKIYQQLKENKESYNKYSDLTLVGFTLGKKEESLKNFKIMLEKSPLVPSYLLFDPFWEEFFQDADVQKLTSQNLKYP
ncbi:MAG: winged helix-turn-helix domain-containing protein [Pyrinomonadaceae bacterium]|nr:winged helix-turn-helix domain-containing protein [Pyrinomonadaceae bacterium]